MALVRIEPKAWRRVWKRRRKNERRVRRMQRALRWNLYLTPVAKIVESVTGIFRRR